MHILQNGVLLDDDSIESILVQTTRLLVIDQVTY